MGINNNEDAKELVGCIGWDLNKRQVEELEQASKLKAVFDEDAVGISPLHL